MIGKNKQYTNKSNDLFGLALLLFSFLFFQSCPEQHKKQAPLGWNMNQQKVQLLARSYHGTPWLSMMLHPPQKNTRLLHIALYDLPTSKDIFAGFQRLLMRKKSRQPQVPAKKQKQHPLGLKLYFRSSQPWGLHLVLKTNQQRYHQQQKPVVKTSGNHWKSMVLYWKDFCKQPKKPTEPKKPAEPKKSVEPKKSPTTVKKAATKQPPPTKEPKKVKKTQQTKETKKNCYRYRPGASLEFWGNQQTLGKDSFGITLQQPIWIWKN